MWHKNDKKDKQGNILIPKDRPNRLGRREQLCWDCKNAVGRCPWSRNFTPVDGWDAEADGDGYKIYDCPLFVEG